MYTYHISYTICLKSLCGIYTVLRNALLINSPSDIRLRIGMNLDSDDAFLSHYKPKLFKWSR